MYKYSNDSDNDCYVKILRSLGTLVNNLFPLVSPYQMSNVSMKEIGNGALNFKHLGYLNVKSGTPPDNI